MPADAKKKDAAGVKAFAEYYFELLQYTIQTSNPAPLKTVTSEHCALCASGFIDPAARNKKSGGWASGGAYDAEITLATVADGGNGTAVFSYMQSEMVIYNSGGSLNGRLPATESPVIGSLAIEYAGGWQVTHIDIDSTSS